MAFKSILFAWKSFFIFCPDFPIFYEDAWNLQKKKPLQIRLKEAEAREAKIEDLEETNPEKAEALKEKKKWKDATTRVMGEKVRLALNFKL